MGRFPAAVGDIAWQCSYGKASVAVQISWVFDEGDQTNNEEHNRKSVRKYAQRLELSHLRWDQCPGFRVHGKTEPGNKASINFIVLGGLHIGSLWAKDL